MNYYINALLRCIKLTSNYSKCRCFFMSINIIKKHDEINPCNIIFKTIPVFYRSNNNLIKQYNAIIKRKLFSDICSLFSIQPSFYKFKEFSSLYNPSDKITFIIIHSPIIGLMPKTIAQELHKLFYD